MATQGQKIEQAFWTDEELMNLYEQFISTDTGKFDSSVKELIDTITGDLITNDAGKLTLAGDNIVTLDRMEDTIVDYLQSDAAEELADEMYKTIELRLDTVNDLVENAGLGGLAVDRPKELNRVVDAINTIGEKVVAGRDWSVEEFRDLMLQVRGDLQKGDLIDVEVFKDRLKTKGGVLPRYIKTVSDTQLAAVDRIVRREQAKKGDINTMKYLGPMDSVTRPFCRNHVGYIKSIEEWESMSNDTGPNPVIDYCGGWFCRHRLIVYKPEWDE